MLMLPSDIRVIDAAAYFSHEYPRATLKFGGRIAGKVTFAHVRIRVQNRRGEVADGWGAILLSHYWAFSTKAVDHDTKDTLMQRVTWAYCQRLTDFTAFAYPIDIFMSLQPELYEINLRMCREMSLTEVMPYLGMLVCASPLDAALHDAFGIVNGVSSYEALSADWISHDLSTYLGPDFTRHYLNEFLRPAFSPRLAVSIPESEVHPRITRIQDGELLTDSLQGPGSGYQLHAIQRDLFQTNNSTGTGGH